MSVPSTLAWLKELGMKFGPQPIYLLTQNTTRIAAMGGGLALIETLRAKALALGGEIRYRTTAIDLVRGIQKSVDFSVQHLVPFDILAILDN